jgi:hypothetical protein
VIFAIGIGPAVSMGLATVERLSLVSLKNR